MPILAYHDSQGRYTEREFKDYIRIGSDLFSNDLAFPDCNGLFPHHATIVFSRFNRNYVLVNVAEKNTWVNGRRVLSIQTLKHKDLLQMSSICLLFRDFYIVQRQSEHLEKQCNLCHSPIQIVQDEKILICSHCSALYHQRCAFVPIECATQLCHYPFLERIINILTPEIKIERSPGEFSDLVKQKNFCPAGLENDISPFQPEEPAMYCPGPSCNTPFHLKCWPQLDYCPVCAFDIQAFIGRLFSSSSDYLPPELAYVK